MIAEAGPVTSVNSSLSGGPRSGQYAGSEPGPLSADVKHVPVATHDPPSDKDVVNSGSSSVAEVGTHPEVEMVGQRPVAERGPPQVPQRLSLPKVGDLDPGSKQGTGRVGLPVGQQGAGALKNQSAVDSNLARRGVDHPQAGAWSAGGEQLLGGLREQRQAGRRLSNCAGVQVRGARMVARGSGEQSQTASRPGCRPELVGPQVAEPGPGKIFTRVGPDGGHEFAPPPVRRPVEHRPPAVRDRWYQNVHTRRVLVD